jgi:hypothetical protein
MAPNPGFWYFDWRVMVNFGGGIVESEGDESGLGLFEPAVVVSSSLCTASAY